ncbi:leucine-rich repeat domain-containing protein [Spirosoma areae]
MKKALFIVLVGLIALPGWAQDRIALLRDTTRLGISVATLEKGYPPAFGRLLVKNGVTKAEEGVFSWQGKTFNDSLSATHKRFFRYIEQNKRRLPVPGLIMQTQEFIRPDGSYERVLCEFSGMDLTDEQETQVLILIAEWYGQHPFPIKTPTGFRQQNFMQLGSIPEKRRVRTGRGIVATLEAAEKTTRPDTVTMLAFNQLELKTVPEVVYRFPNLQELDLSRNSLHELPARLTADIPALKRLSLLYNALPTDSVFITPNKHLLALNLQGNKLTQLPKSVRQNRRLESLWLGNNELKNLNLKPLRRLRRLNDLNLYNASLTQLPRTIGRLKHVKVLDLYYNKLAQLPRQLGRMKRLEQLAIAHNELHELPPSLSKLRQLQVLFTHHNKLSQLPGEFQKLASLRVLDLGYNWFNTAPAVLGALPALEELDLNNNNLQAFPAVLTSIRNLKKVYLGSNPLFGKEAMTSPYASQIKQLEANNTQVTY